MVIGASREVAKEGMRINAVTPGVIDTDIQPPGRVERVTPMLPMGRAGQADEVAEAILFLCRMGILYQRRKLARVGRALNRLALAARLPMIAADIAFQHKHKHIQGVKHGRGSARSQTRRS